MQNNGLTVPLSGRAHVDLPDPSQYTSIFTGQSYDSDNPISGHVESRIEYAQSAVMQSFMDEIIRGVESAYVEPSQIHVPIMTKMTPKKMLEVMGINPKIRKVIDEVSTNTVPVAHLMDTHEFNIAPFVLPDISNITSQDYISNVSWNQMSEEEKLTMVGPYLVKDLKPGDLVRI